MKFSEGVLLAQDPHSGCAVVRGHVHHICLPPRYLNGGIKNGVREILTNQLGRYNDNLDGILLAFCKIKIMQRNAVLLYDNVEMHFDVQYDVVIFRAVPGSLLKCNINEVSTDHLSCLIHKMINIAVALPEVNFDLHDPKGLAVVCRVEKVEYKKGVLGLSGELTDDSLKTLQEFYTEAYASYPERDPTVVGKHNFDQNSVNVSLDSKIGTETNEDMSHDDTEDGGDTLSGESSRRGRTSKKKKKKKRKIKEESATTSNFDDQKMADSYLERDPTVIGKHNFDQNSVNVSHDSKIGSETNEDISQDDTEDGGDTLSGESSRRGRMSKKKKKRKIKEESETTSNFDDQKMADSSIETEEKRKHSKKERKEKERIDLGCSELDVDLPSPDEIEAMMQKKKKRKKIKQEKLSAEEETDSVLVDEISVKTPNKKKRKRKHFTTD